MLDATPSVLFVCWGHVCRSVMAEALARKRYGSVGSFESAGIDPQIAEDARSVLETLRYEFGVVMSSHVPRGLNDIDLSKFTYLVAMDKEVGRRLKRQTNREIVVWNIKDPWDEPVAIRRCAIQILNKLQQFVNDAGIGKR